VRTGDLIFTAGQIPLEPESGKMVAGGVGVQTRRVLESLREVLAAGGAGLEDVVKTTVYMTDLSAFAEMNEVYAGFFGTKMPPARAAVEVRALPKGALVEIDAVARRPAD